MNEGNNEHEAVQEDLAASVQRYRVCWEAGPEIAFVEQASRKIGFSLELFGTQEPGTAPLSPGCDRCILIENALKRIIHSILPKDKRLSRYEVTIGSQSLSYSRSRGQRPDVGATIRILHRGAWDGPVDDCEERCLKEMEQALIGLGASEGAWQAH
jgi:hypothetical protein